MIRVQGAPGYRYKGNCIMKPFKTLFVVLLLSAVLMACGPKNTGQNSTAVQESTKSSAPSASTPAGNLEKATISQGMTAAPMPTVIRKPTALPTTAAQPINLIDKPFFLQEDQTLTVIFLVENPNEGHTVENSQYQLTVSDESGTVLKRIPGILNYYCPTNNWLWSQNYPWKVGKKRRKSRPN